MAAPGADDIRTRVVDERWSVHISKVQIDDRSIVVQRNNVQHQLHLAGGDASKGGKWSEESWKKMREWFGKPRRGWTPTASLPPPGPGGPPPPPGQLALPAPEPAQDAPPVGAAVLPEPQAADPPPPPLAEEEAAQEASGSSSDEPEGRADVGEKSDGGETDVVDLVTNHPLHEELSESFDAAQAQNRVLEERIQGMGEEIAVLQAERDDLRAEISRLHAKRPRSSSDSDYTGEDSE